MKSGFNGRHMAAIMVGFFAVVIAVNLFMARMASATFGGVVVENSYVASQKFNDWLAAAEAQKALGWTIAATREADGRVAVAVAGLPQGTGAVVQAMARHPLGRQPERALAFSPGADGRYRSAQALPAGRWILRMDVRADGQLARVEQDLP